tara:strand:- start:2379 stop:2660 length:282 start_codon:yes stop_codon:yes gene_type:complete
MCIRVKVGALLSLIISGCSYFPPKDCQQWSENAAQVMTLRQSGYDINSSKFDGFDSDLIEEAFLLPVMESESLKLMAISKFKLNRLLVCEGSE